MNALAKALSESDRSYAACKAAVSNATSAMLAEGPAGNISTRSDLSTAAEQLKHFTGWVYASVRPIAQRIAGQPIRVGKKKGKRRVGVKSFQDAEAFESHELLDLLADPNDLMVAWSLVYVTVASLELTGRQLWWITKVDGRRQILPIPTSWITGFHGSTKIDAFRIRPPKVGEAFLVPADECCYFVYPSPGDPKGAWSPLQAVAAAVDSDEAIESSRITAFRQGIHSTHAIRIGKDPGENMGRPRLTPEQQRQIVAAVKRRYAGLGRNEPLILDGLVEDVFKLSNTPAEMDWLSSEKATKARVMQGFGVNPIIVGEVEGANRASSLAAEDHFIGYTVNPKIELLSQTMSEWLGPMFGDVLVWIEPCVVRDDEMALKKITLAAANGSLTVAELRAFCGLPEDKQFDGEIVGGKNLQTTSPIEAGIRQMVTNALGGIEADKLLEALQ